MPDIGRPESGCQHMEIQSFGTGFSESLTGQTECWLLGYTDVENQSATARAAGTKPWILLKVRLVLCAIFEKQFKTNLIFWFVSWLSYCREANAQSGPLKVPEGFKQVRQMGCAWFTKKKCASSGGEREADVLQ